MLFIYKQGTVQIIQQPDTDQLIYTGPSTDVRRVRLNDHDVVNSAAISSEGFCRITPVLYLRTGRKWLQTAVDYR
jgi:hypothetical protein